MKTLILISFLSIILIGGCGRDRHPAELAGNAELTQAQTEYYTCVMHPWVHSDKPGACPICGMTLVKKTASNDAIRNDTLSVDSVSLSPRQRVLANVQTATVNKESMSKEIDAVGIIDFAEPNLRHITMRFSGRLERLFLEFTGQKVRRGDPVALVYSPEAITAEQEFILALKSADGSRQSDSTIAGEPALLLSRSKEKLVLLGFSASQIDSLQKTRKAENLITIVSPITGTVIKKYVDPQHYAAVGEVIYDVADLSTVWMYADVYEQDLRFVKQGQFVDITTDAYPDEVFSGNVTFVEPVMNSDTRTLRIRTEFINQEGKLKPQMFVSAQFYHVIPKALVIPSSALLMTGKRTIVWVETAPDVFRPRDVKIGTESEGEAEVLSGLREGETVATMGGFLIDSESALDHPARWAAREGHAANQHDN